MLASPTAGRGKMSNRVTSGRQRPGPGQQRRFDVAAGGLFGDDDREVLLDRQEARHRDLRRNRIGAGAQHRVEVDLGDGDARRLRCRTPRRGRAAARRACRSASPTLTESPTGPGWSAGWLDALGSRRSESAESDVISASTIPFRSKKSSSSPAAPKRPSGSARRQ